MEGIFIAHVCCVPVQNIWKNLIKFGPCAE